MWTRESQHMRTKKKKERKKEEVIRSRDEG